MAEPFSIAASAIGLLTTAAKIGKGLHDLVKDIKDAPDDLKALKDDFDATVLIVNELKEQESLGKLHNIPQHTLKGFAPVILSCEFTFTRLATLLDKYDKICAVKPSTSVLLQKRYQKGLWSVKGKSEAIGLARQLANEKQTLDLQFQMMNRITSLSVQITGEETKQNTEEIIAQITLLQDRLLSKTEGLEGVRAQTAARELRSWAIQTSTYAASILSSYPPGVAREAEPVSPPLAQHSPSTSYTSSTDSLHFYDARGPEKNNMNEKGSIVSSSSNTHPEFDSITGDAQPTEHIRSASSQADLQHNDAHFEMLNGNLKAMQLNNYGISTSQDTNPGAVTGECVRSDEELDHSSKIYPTLSISQYLTSPVPLKPPSTPSQTAGYPPFLQQQPHSTLLSPDSNRTPTPAGSKQSDPNTTDTSYEPGLQVLHNIANATADIIAVHGIGAKPQYAWRPLKKIDGIITGDYGPHWLKDTNMLPAELPNARILVFNYSADWLGTTSRTSFGAIGEDLLDAIYAEREESANETSSDEPRRRPIVFVGHNFGGNVIQKAIVNSLKSVRFSAIARCVSGVAFLGTPTGGTNAIATLERLRDMSSGFGNHNTSMFNEVKSGLLYETAHNFCLFVQYNQVDLTFFFETKKTIYGHALFRWNAIVVPEESATVVGYPKVALDADHVGLSKFEGPDDPSYIKVQNELQMMVRTAPEKIQQRLAPEMPTRTNRPRSER